MRTAQGLAVADAEGAIGDLGELYRSLSKRLEQIVRVGVQAPDAVIEDACQFAWSRLVHHRERVHRETALGWLVKTAVHEAFKLTRRGCRDLSLDAAVEQRSDLAPAGASSSLEDLLEQHERLATVSSLPRRQQRLLWLRALGLSYEEIGAHERCTPRTVERQLTRARRALRAAGAIAEAPTARARVCAAAAPPG
jgi:RNA polymerase sigma factor (sigma-70 family)